MAILTGGTLLLGASAAWAQSVAADARVERTRSGRVFFVAEGRAGGGLLQAGAGLNPAASDDALSAVAPLFGIHDPAAELSLVRIEGDDLGWTHRSYAQVHDGVRVFGATLRQHVRPDGLTTSINGDIFAVTPKLSVSPVISAEQAQNIAVAAMDDAVAQALNTELVIVDPAWYGNQPSGPHLAWSMVLVDESLPMEEQVFVDAHAGEVIDHWTLIADAEVRQIYDGGGTNGLPGTLARSEGQSPVSDAEVNAAYDYYGDVYGFYQRAFGRDGIDGAGLTMVATVHSTAPGCPNAFWSPTLLQMVFCNGLVRDDVIGHELTHGVTQFTSGLLYINQSGQINEGMSDIFGELIDLYNGNCAFAGPPGGPAWPTHPTGPGVDTPNNLRSTCSLAGDGYPDGVRWLMGEDATGFSGAIRDMWQPSCRNHPDTTSDPHQTCNPGDSGGVHSGSGILNHAFSMTTDGKTFNGHTVTGIGPIKAAAIWYRAQTVYFTPVTDYPAAYVALNQAASDLVGSTPLDPRTGAASGSAITAFDAAQVNEALLAVEMNQPGNCGAADPVVLSDPPVLCANRATLFADDFESGPNGWTVSNSNPPTPYDWVQTADLPAHSGTAWFISDPDLGNCGSNDESGAHALTSPPITIPPGAAYPAVKFTHFLISEGGWDGGNLKISVNNGPWTLVPRTAFEFNPYNGRLNTSAQTNTDPLAGEDAFTGGGGGWGTSVASLAGLAPSGSSVRLRFDFGKDGCTGGRGWYVDDFELFNCPDCNTNGRPDQRDFRFTSASEPLGNIGDGSPQSFTIASPPVAASDVTIMVTAVGDFSSAAEFLDVDVNGAFVGQVFATNASDCPNTPDRQSLPMTAAAWNAAVAGGSANIHLAATPDVNATPNLANCRGATYLTLQVSYARGETPDLNGNGIPDSCEPSVIAGDMNCDGVVDNSDIDGFVLALIDPAGYHAAYPSCDISAADTSGDGVVDNGDIDSFVACLLSGGCP